MMLSNIVNRIEDKDLKEILVAGLVELYNASIEVFMKMNDVGVIK